LYSCGDLRYLGPNPKASPKQSQAVFVFHGYGANAEDLAPIADAVDPTRVFDWYFFDGLNSVEPSMPMFRARSWFQFPFQELERAFRNKDWNALHTAGVPGMLDSLQKLEKPLSVLARDYPEGIHLMGFSQGSIIAYFVYILMDSIRTQVRTLNLLSSSLLEKHLARSKLDAIPVDERNRVRVLLSHGIQDPVLPFALGKSLHGFFQDYFTKLQFHEFNGGHEIPSRVIDLLQRNIFFEAFEGEEE
jgi:phospholipase/carboxylesterase